MERPPQGYCIAEGRADIKAVISNTPPRFLVRNKCQFMVLSTGISTSKTIIISNRFSMCRQALCRLQPEADAAAVFGTRNALRLSSAITVARTY